MFSPKIVTPPTIEYLLTENLMLREEIKVAREASAITAKLVVKQFEETEKILRKFQRANAERQAVLDAATQLSIIATDLDGTITLFSPGATTLLGYSEDEMVKKRNISSLHLEDEIYYYGKKLLGTANAPEELLGENLSDDLSNSSISNVNPEFDTATIDAIRVFDQYVKQKISRSSDWTYVKKDGSFLPINLSITPFHNARGSLKGYLFTAMDMTSHKIMEQELIEAIKNAESANAAKGDFLARMSHEIRTPMNGVLGMAHLLKKTELSSKQRNYLDKILSSANNLLNLINDILDFSKIDAGKLEIESINFNLEDILSQIVNSIGLITEVKGLELIFEVQDNVPFNLIGDPLRLGQVLLNLASNAVKFTEYGEIIITVSLEELSGDNVTLKFSVRDSGIGLYPEQIEPLFDAFSQADDSITRKYGGTGLGLSICRQLTEMMGGRIWVENSAPGKGSEFTFTSRFKLSGDAIFSSVENAESFKGIRALVVDDNQTARHVLKAMLESFKISVDTACNGNEAISLIERAVKSVKPYDVILLDWIMPGIDGIETARRIRANPEYGKIPAMLMVTANGREDARIEAEQAGIKGFLLKPVYASVMYNTLLDMLNIKSVKKWLNNGKEDDIKVSKAIKGLAGAYILLVEDNPINQEVATELLRDAGIVVRIASNGLESLNMVDKEPFDLVLMDIQMPVMDGLEAAHRIRHEKRMADIPIIAMTAHAMAGDREKSFKVGMNGHINKPVSPAELYSVLSQFINKKTQILHTLPNDEPQNASPKKLNDNTSPILTKLPEKNVAERFNFPDIKGIDHKTAIKRLNNKPQMFINILKDFKKNYTEEPEQIKVLFIQGNAQEIQMRAHSIKGIAGYMGADALFRSAADLEDYLKINQGVLLAEAAQYIESLTDNIEQVLESISLFTSLQNEEVEPTNTEQTSKELSFNSKNITNANLQHIEQFISLLKNGDATATDLLPHVDEIFIAQGYKDELKTVLELIDDIEYETAANIVFDIYMQLNERLKEQHELPRLKQRGC